MLDWLGTERFDRVRHWTGAGHLDGEFDPAEPQRFTCARDGDRWSFTGDHGVLVVGDAARDLVSTRGGLARQPAGSGFRRYLSSCLLRRIEVTRAEELSRLEVVGGPWMAEHAGRPAHDYRLRGPKADLLLGVDDEAGIWTHFESADVRSTLDRLTIGSADEASLALLTLVPDVDLTARDARGAEAISALVDAVAAASGCGVQVMYHDQEAGEFRLVLLDSHDVPQGIVSRLHDTSAWPATFGGVQDRQEHDGWLRTIDLVSPDVERLGRISRVLDETL